MSLKQRMKFSCWRSTQEKKMIDSNQVPFIRKEWLDQSEESI